MDPKLVYWTWALFNFLLVVVFAGLGVRRIRERELQRHKRMMLAASVLVIAFLVSYPVKVVTLGREDLEVWEALSKWLLRIHETFIVGMLLGGSYAGWRAFGFRRSLPLSGLLPREPSPPRTRVLHRRAGWVAVVSSVCAFLTACGVLWGMYARA